MSTPQGHVPGSRAIKIPLHSGFGGLIDNDDSHISSRRRRLNNSRRSVHDHLSGSDDSMSPASISASTSRTRGNALLGTQKTVVSPSNTDGTVRGSHDGGHLHRHHHHKEPVTPITGQRKDKHRAGGIAPPNTLPASTLFEPSSSYNSPLGPSMLSSSAYKSINLNAPYSGDSDEPARLITYTKHSQGFTWNDELFLPSYLTGRRYGYGGGRGGVARRRGHDDGLDDEMDGVGDFDEEADRCPVADIFVTDEEAAAMMP